jgi:Protein of unknown function (DUF3108)
VRSSFVIGGLCLILFSVIALPGTLETGPATQTSSQKHPPAKGGLAYPIGEKFTYVVSWKVFDAGIATLSLADRFHFQNEELYRITATVRSTGIVSSLFKVVDFFESHMSVGELCSRGIVKNIQEGRRQRTTALSFDNKKRQARMEDIDLNRPELPPKHSESPIPACVQDVVSAFYFVRSQDLKVGETLRFPINDGGKTYDVDVEVQAVESVKTPAGVFQAFRLEPKVFGGLFRNKGRLFVWLTNNSEKTPVMLKARIAIGTITASLTNSERAPTIQAPPSKGKK